MNIMFQFMIFIIFFLIFCLLAALATMLRFDIKDDRDIANLEKSVLKN